MKYLSLIFFTAILFLVSCGESNPYADSVIEMNTTPCFGACPEYDITIKGDGTATYVGKRHAPRAGEYTKQLPVEETRALFDAFAAVDFFAFEEKYTSNISDLSTTFISFSHNGQSKKIEDYYGAPDELDKLENRVEAIAKSEGWKKAE